MASIFLQNQPGADCAAPVASAVDLLVNGQCAKTVGELLSLHTQSVRRNTPYLPMSGLSEAAATPYTMPLVTPISGGNQLSIMNSGYVQFTPLDYVVGYPTPIPDATDNLGPDVNVSRGITLTSGIGSVDNFPFIQNPQYKGVPSAGIIAWQTVVPIFGTLLKVSWTDNDNTSYLEIGRTFLNAPGTPLELARIVPSDDKCHQTTVFLPFYDHRFEIQSKGDLLLRAIPADYSPYYNAGDDRIATNPSLAPWSLRVMAAGAVKTSGYSWSVEAIPVPLTRELLMTLMPLWDESSHKFTKNP